MVGKNLRKLIVRIRRDWYLPWAGLGTLLTVISLAGIAYLATRSVGEFDIFPRAVGENIAYPKGIYALMTFDWDSEEPVPEDDPIPTPSSLAGQPGDDLSKLGYVLDQDYISGVVLRLRWKNLEPSENAYDFSFIDNVVRAAAQRGKTVQLILLPGFYTPKWLLDQIPSCDPLLKNNPVYDPNQACGKASFLIDGSAWRRQDLPLPWNPLYKSKWQKFLAEIAGRYNQNPAVVSVAVTGPNSISAEMRMPGDTSREIEKWQNILILHFPENDPRRNSNLAFVQEWWQTINIYDAIFENKTLVLTFGSGLIDFPVDGVTDGPTPGPPDYKDSQVAKQEIINYFVLRPYAKNLKATQTSGLKACRGFPGGIGTVRELTAKGLVGGSQFNSTFDLNHIVLGCEDRNYCSKDASWTLVDGCYYDGPGFHPCCELSYSRSLRNVLKQYFENTTLGAKYETEAGKYRMNYLQMYSWDIVRGSEPGGFTSDPEVTALLNEVNRDLLQTGRVLPPTPTPTPTPLPPVSDPVVNNFTIQAILQNQDGSQTVLPNISAAGIIRFEDGNGKPLKTRVNWAKCMNGGALSLPIVSGGTPCNSFAPGRYATQWKKTVKINKQEYNLLWPNTGCTNKVCEQSEMITGGQPIHRGVYQAPAPKPTNPPKPTKIPKKSR